MNEYELMYVISPRLMVEEADATIERVQGLIKDAGGEILMTDNWGRRRLAYPIKHHFEGTYVLSHVTLPPDRIAAFERAMHLNEHILRHLLIRGFIPGYDGPPEEEVMYQRRASSRPVPPRDDAPPPEAEPEAAEASAVEPEAAAAPAAEPEAAEASAVEPEAAEASAVEPEAAAAPAAASAE